MDDHADSCPWCRAALDAASRLRFKKLGKHERRQLLDAAPPGQSPTPIVPPGPSQADQTATRRAVASLRDRGLIELEQGAVRLYSTDADAGKLLETLGRKYMVLRRAWRTPLGEQVVRHYQQELESGARIRWTTGRLDEVVEQVLAGCPHR